MTTDRIYFANPEDAERRCRADYYRIPCRSGAAGLHGAQWGDGDHAYPVTVYETPIPANQQRLTKP